MQGFPWAKHKIYMFSFWIEPDADFILQMIKFDMLIINPLISRCALLHG
jgi:uncharacterized protein YozE (UPF0346 family)